MYVNSLACVRVKCGESLDVKKARRMEYDRSEWWRFVSLDCMRCNPGDEPLTLTRYHGYMKTLKGGSLSMANPTT